MTERPLSFEEIDGIPPDKSWLENQLHETEERGRKRAIRLLNPHDDHPFLHGIYADMAYMTELINPEDNIQSGYFTVDQAIEDARAIADPNESKHVAQEKCRMGYERLTPLLEKFTPTRKPRRVSPYETRSELQRYTGNSQNLRMTVQCIDFITEELQNQQTELTPEERIGTFAAVVGFAQSVFVHELQAVEKKDKHRIRDQVLTYSLHALQRTEQQGMVNYLLAQKTRLPRNYFFTLIFNILSL